MTNDLVAFLRACLDEDEALTRSIPGPSWERRQIKGDLDEPVVFEDYVATADPDRNDVVLSDVRAEVLPFVLRHDPARVLAEVVAKRGILDRHQSHSMGGCRVCEAPHWGVKVCNHCYGQKWPCPDVRDLVAVYADHPDYRPEWAPDA